MRDGWKRKAQSVRSTELPDAFFYQNMATGEQSERAVHIQAVTKNEQIP